MSVTKPAQRKPYTPTASGIMVASPAQQSAPVIVIKPATPQASNNQPGAPIERADSAEVIKIPEPIIEPITIIVASIGPRARTKLVSWRLPILSLMQSVAGCSARRRQSNAKGRNPNDEWRKNYETRMTKCSHHQHRALFELRHSDLFRHTAFVLRHSDFMKSFPARELLHLLFQAAIAARTQSPRRLAYRRARKLSPPGHRHPLHRRIEPCLRAAFATRVRLLPRDRAAGHPVANAEPAPHRSDNCDPQKLRVRFLIHSLDQPKRARSSLVPKESALDRPPQSRVPPPWQDQHRAPPYYIERRAVLHDFAEHRRLRRSLEKRRVDKSLHQKLHRM